MSFKKGTINNPAGRPKGAVTKFQNPTEELLAGIHKFLKKNISNILDDLETPAAREKARIYCDLLKYAVPRLNPRSGEIRFEDMTTEQLEQFLAIMMKRALPQVLKTK